MRKDAAFKVFAKRLADIGRWRMATCSRFPAGTTLRSTFYYQQRAVVCEDKHRDLKANNRAIFDRHKGLYGYRRVTADLRGAGHTVDHQSVQRLMRQMQLRSRRVRQAPPNPIKVARSRTWQPLPFAGYPAQQAAIGNSQLRTSRPGSAPVGSPLR